jgi:SHS2 domain-containing protein
MNQFTIKEDPSMIKILASGRNQKELLIGFSEGLMTYLYGESTNISRYDIKSELKAEGKDFPDLAGAWLARLLELSQNQSIIYNEFIFKKNTENELIAIIYGRQAKAIKKLKANAKNKIEIIKNKDGFTGTAEFSY